MIRTRDWSRPQRLWLGEAGALGFGSVTSVLLQRRCSPGLSSLLVTSSCHPATQPCPLNETTCTLCGTVMLAWCVCPLVVSVMNTLLMDWRVSRTSLWSSPAQPGCLLQNHLHTGVGGWFYCMCVPSGGLCHNYLVAGLVAVTSLPLIQSSYDG